MVAFAEARHYLVEDGMVVVMVVEVVVMVMVETVVVVFVVGYGMVVVMGVWRPWYI